MITMPALTVKIRLGCMSELVVKFLVGRMVVIGCKMDNEIQEENSVDEVRQYAEQWNVSAKFFYDKGYYQWMEKAITTYHTILEIGCGTGYSTLALTQGGHRVIAIDKNPDCIKTAEELLTNNGIKDESVVFLEGDIANDTFRDIVLKQDFDAVICWNVGTYWSGEMMRSYMPYLLEYGLSVEQIKQNPESSYAELIIWDSCRIACQKQVPINIIERGVQQIDKKTDPYYYTLKKEFHYSTIKYDNCSGLSISSGGRMLSTNGQVNKEKEIGVIFASITMK